MEKKRARRARPPQRNVSSGSKGKQSKPSAAVKAVKKTAKASVLLKKKKPVLPAAKKKITMLKVVKPAKPVVSKKVIKKKVAVPQKAPAKKKTISVKSKPAAPVKSARVSKTISKLPVLESTRSRDMANPVQTTVSAPIQKVKAIFPQAVKTAKAKAVPKTPVPRGVKKIVPLHHETETFETLPLIEDLPFSYNVTKLVLMVRDPFWAYTYWDFSAQTWEWINSLRSKDPGICAKLRIHNLDSGSSHDLDVSLEAKCWYVELGLPHTLFQLELGLLDSKGHFYSIVKSNRMCTPRQVPSDVVDHQWESSAWEFSEIYRLSGGGKHLSGHSDAFSSLRRRKN